MVMSSAIFSGVRWRGAGVTNSAVRRGGKKNEVWYPLTGEGREGGRRPNVITQYAVLGNSIDLQSQTAVTAYFSSEQLLLFPFKADSPYLRLPFLLSGLYISRAATILREKCIKSLTTICHIYITEEQEEPDGVLQGSQIKIKKQ